MGINVAIAPSVEAISYAIALDAVYPHIQSMVVRGSVSRPDFGFTPITVTPSVAASFGLELDRASWSWILTRPRQRPAQGYTPAMSSRRSTTIKSTM